MSISDMEMCLLRDLMALNSDEDLKRVVEFRESLKKVPVKDSEVGNTITLPEGGVIPWKDVDDFFIEIHANEVGELFCTIVMECSCNHCECPYRGTYKTYPLEHLKDVLTEFNDLRKKAGLLEVRLQI